MATSKNQEENAAQEAESVAEGDEAPEEAQAAQHQEEQEVGTESEVEAEVEDESSALRERLADAEDRALRAHAEADNIQRRAARDVENAHKFGVERLVRDLIPVIDSLERAVELAKSGGEEGSDAEGVELATKLLIDTLSRHGVARIAPQGEPFDPAWHEAVATAPNDACEENSVLDVVQPGFSLNGRLVRAAKVVVSRASTA